MSRHSFNLSKTFKFIYGRDIFYHKFLNICLIIHCWQIIINTLNKDNLLDNKVKVKPKFGKGTYNIQTHWDFHSNSLMQRLWWLITARINHCKSLLHLTDVSNRLLARTCITLPGNISLKQKSWKVSFAKCHLLHPIEQVHQVLISYLIGTAKRDIYLYLINQESY